LVVALSTASNLSADVRISMHEGQVSLSATDATVAEILAEWARIGQTRILNTERIAPDRMTVDLQNVSEQAALEVVLRMTGGYLAVWRAVDIRDGSSFERIVVMPRGVAPVAVAVAVAANRAAPPPDKSPADSLGADLEPEVVQAHAAEGDATTPPDQQEPVSLAGAVPIPSAQAQVPLRARHALEVVDPRQFRLPPVAGGVNRPPTGVPPSPGVPVPGMVIRPEPQPTGPRVPGQVPAVRQ
jgi:hypothetical protein